MFCEQATRFYITVLTSCSSDRVVTQRRIMYHEQCFQRLDELVAHASVMRPDLSCNGPSHHNHNPSIIYHQSKTAYQWSSVIHTHSGVNKKPPITKSHSHQAYEHTSPGRPGPGGSRRHRRAAATTALLHCMLCNTDASDE